MRNNFTDRLLGRDTSSKSNNSPMLTANQSQTPTRTPISGKGMMLPDIRNVVLNRESTPDESLLDP